MDGLQVINDERFGKVRIVNHNGEPWLMGKDVATIAGYSNPRDALLKHVDKEDKDVAICDTLGGKQEMVIINESGFYSLIFSSKLKTAKEFKHWVTKEVLPSIRKNGYYMVDSKDKEDSIVRQAIAILDNRLQKANEKIQLLEAKVESDAPKVAFAEELETSDKCITIKQLSVLLYQNGYVTGEKRLFDEMRGDGFLCTRGEYKNEPAQRYLEMGLFVVKTSTFQYNSGSVGVSRKTLVTQKGVKYLLNYYLKKHGLLVESSANNLLPENTQAMFSLVQ